MKAIEKPQAIITTTLFILLAFIALIITMTGCMSERVDGNRDLVTLERSSQGFSEVVSQGSFSVVVIPSDVTRIVVKGESNVLPYLSTASDGTTITVKFENGYNIREHYPVEVFLYTPVLESVKLSGSGMVECGAFNEDKVNLDVSGSGSINGVFTTENLDALISGSGNISLAGIATNTYFHISGSGNITAPDLEEEHCIAGISGSGNITTLANQTLDATVSGSGCVFYLGNPDVTTHISGSGKVLKY